jgi:hypothetical protein
MDDPDWHRYSNKLEKIAKWQSKIEMSLGFDPAEYFGGMIEDDEDLEHVKKDPRFSGKFNPSSELLLINRYV